MKKSFQLLFITLIFLSISCSQNRKPDQLQKMVDDVITIDPEKLSGSEPISRITEELNKKADKIILIEKVNIAESLEEARKYSKIFLVVETHTLIKIENLDDCQKSTSWGTCMPKGIGLIQKESEFEKKNDYINNLIGKPDNQIRKMYLFK